MTRFKEINTDKFIFRIFLKIFFKRNTYNKNIPPYIQITLEIEIAVLQPSLITSVRAL